MAALTEFEQLVSDLNNLQCGVDRLEIKLEREKRKIHAARGRVAEHEDSPKKPNERVAVTLPMEGSRGQQWTFIIGANGHYTKMPCHSRRHR